VQRPWPRRSTDPKLSLVLYVSLAPLAFQKSVKQLPGRIVTLWQKSHLLLRPILAECSARLGSHAPVNEVGGCEIAHHSCGIERMGIEVGGFCTIGWNE
jgi:hypothetical protein